MKDIDSERAEPSCFFPPHSVWSPTTLWWPRGRQIRGPALWPTAPAFSMSRYSEGRRLTVQSWALEVFFNFFNNEKLLFAIFIKLIWLGVGFLNRTGAEIGYYLDFLKNAKKSFLTIEKFKNTKSAQIWLTQCWLFTHPLAAPGWPEMSAHLRRKLRAFGTKSSRILGRKVSAFGDEEAFEKTYQCPPLTDFFFTAELVFWGLRFCSA